MLKKFYRKLFETDFQKVTAKKVATENGIEYISDAKGEKMNSNGEMVNRYYAGEGKYILLHPANDGMPTCPFEWWGTFDGKPQMIMDNQSSFKGITNLCEIILQMVDLYAKYIDEDMDYLMFDYNNMLLPNLLYMFLNLYFLLELLLLFSYVLKCLHYHYTLNIYHRL